MYKLGCVAGVAVGLCGAAVQAGTVLYVDDDAPLGGDGLSWETAYKFLQDALAEAAGDSGINEIRVGQGTYKPDQDEGGNVASGDREATFQLINGVALIGGFAGFGKPDPDDRDIESYETILTGDLAGDDGPDAANIGDNSLHVVIGSDVSTSAVLDGVTITAGNADGGSFPFDQGGGLFVEDGSPTILDCTFAGNTADGRGGGMSIWNSNACITECTFDGNVMTGTGSGGGLAASLGSQPDITACTFTSNVAVVAGGAIYLSGGSAEIVDCTFIGNVGGNDGGALLAWVASVTGCTFIDNSALEGGGIRGLSSALVVSDCHFLDNSADIGGAANSGGTYVHCTFEGNIALLHGGAFEEYTEVTLSDCTFIGNIAGDDGGGFDSSAFPSTVTNCTFRDNLAGNNGGGASVLNTTVTGCEFEGNSADLGAGLYHVASFTAVDVTDCTFTENLADQGGGLYNDGEATVTNCTFSDNSASAGGGIYNLTSELRMIGCSLSANHAAFDGGGGTYNEGSSPTIARCMFSGNTASGAFGGGAGGGMFNNGSDPMVVDCAFIGNDVSFYFGGIGGAIFNTDSKPQIANCTFSGNLASLGGALFSSDASEALVSDSILWGDYGEVVDYEDAATTVRYSIVQGGFAGPGNIEANPLFMDPAGGDYRLLPGSPAIDAGNNWGVPQDTLDLDGDGNTKELIPFDLDGNPRFNADPADFDPGCGVPVVVDMGAYEFQFDPVAEVLLGDIDGSGAVGIVDLLALLTAWGPCTEECCLADLDLDGVIGVTDLLIVLGNWG